MTGAPATGAGTPPAVARLRQVAVCLLLTALAFSQSPGRVAPDTKIDLTADPASFLARALHLWTPQTAFGGLQNQAYGYLFPMGPFHLLGIEAGVPPWLVQRAWMSLLLVTAFLGTVRLAARLGLGTPLTRVLAGLAYALSPRVLTELGAISSEVMPLALLPWTVVPLVGPGARAAPLRAAARSALAVLLMGAVNATAALVVLPLPVVFAVAGLRTREGRRLAACEAGALLLATAWWLGPLLLQGRYSQPFLSWIETAATTTRPASLVSALRGTTHWLAYLDVGGVPWWRSGWLTVTSPVVVLDTALLAALGLAGLALRGVPARGRLLAAGGIGLVALTAGHVGPLTPPWASSLQDLLDGPLAPFRNVHKLDPLVRLPLALGLAAVLARPAVPAVRRAAAALVAVALVGSATPMLAGQLVPAGAYDAIPPAWSEAAAWLDARAGEGHALLVPAAGAAQYVWGRPLDEPLQALTHRTTWAVRDAVPLGSAGLTRLLDAVGQRIDTGTASPGLAPVLQRMGVRFLVVRNDLDRSRTGAPLPVLVHQALDGSPGIGRVASFGPAFGGGVLPGLESLRGLDVGYREVEVYEVGPAQRPVDVLPVQGTQVLSGGPESLLQLADRGLLGPAVVLAGDGPAPAGAARVLTDGLRRVERDFGQVRDATTPTLAAADPVAVHQPVGDFTVLPGVSHQTVAQLLGAREVTASTSASDPRAGVRRGPSATPFAAVDGDPDTAWTSGGPHGARGQWLQLDLSQPRDPAGATLRVVDTVHEVSQVVVRSDTGTAVTDLAPGDAAQPLRTPPGPTRSLRVTVTGVRGGDGPGVVAQVSELAVPGVSVARTLVLPHDAPTGAAPLVLVDRAGGGRAGCAGTRTGLTCSPDLGRQGEEEAALDRTLDLDDPTSLVVRGTARPVPGPALDALLDAGSPAVVTASSRSVRDPAGRPGALVDGDPGTSWTAADDDRRPTVTLDLGQSRQVSTVRLVEDEDAARPLRVEVGAPDHLTALDVPADGVLTFPPVVTSRLVLHVLESSTLLSGDPVQGSLVRLPVGLAELEVGGLPPAAPSASVALPCGSGPPVAVDGAVLPTAALTTRRDLLALAPAFLTVCAPGPSVALAAGEHRVVGGSEGALEVAGLTLGDALPPAEAPPRSALPVRWGAQSRSVDVGPGPASYLVVHENANLGWHAVLAGHELTPARLDGWQQAFVLPAGASGRVELQYVPDRAFHRELLVGLGAVVLLLVLARPRRRGPGPGAVAVPVQAPGLPTRAVALAVTALTLVLIGGVWGLLALAVAVPVAVRTRLAPPLAGGALVLAGLLEAVSPWAGPRSPASTGTATQALCLLAVAFVGATLSERASPGPRPGGG